VHGAHDDAVAQGREAKVERGKQVRVGSGHWRVEVIAARLRGTTH
jgi:hypothetical protein